MANSVKVGGTMMWAYLEKPNEMSGKYQFDLCNLSKAAAAALEGLGLVTKESDTKPEKGTFITIKSNYAIKCFNPDGSIVTDSVGNGTKAQVVISAYDWKFKNKSGKSPSAQKIVITELVMFGAEAANDVDETEDVL